MATNAERLAGIETAIDKIQSGAQEYRIGARTWKGGDLEAMYRERDRLQKAVNSESRGSIGIKLANFPC